MGLQDVIDETKKQLAELDEKPAVEPEEPALVPEEEVEEPEAEEVEAEEPGEPEKEPEPEPNPTAADFARMRREKKALEKKLAELEAAKAAPVEKVEKVAETPSTDPEPDRATKYEAWLEWKDRQNEKRISEIEEKFGKTVKDTEHERLISAAVEEFNSYERDFKAIEPSYDEAAKFYTLQLGQSIKMLNPSATPAQIGNLIKSTVLKKASQYANQGLDPAEELYNEAVSFGFSPKSAEEPEEAVEAPRANLSRVAANRARNAGTAAARGRGAPNLTREVAASYSNEEWAKLATSEKKRLLEGG